MQKKGPLLLAILDGWGIRKERNMNAPKLAKTPFFDSLIKNYPNSSLEAAGTAVGLPKGFQGNSEVGHLNIGAGRVVAQAIQRINLSIKNRSFYSNKALLKAVTNCRKKGSTLHLMGLVQREGVHAMSDHLLALLKLAKKKNLKKVYIHIFTDGRDTPPRSARKHILFIEDHIKKNGVGEIKTIIGRYYSMDRDKRWMRTKLAYDCINNGEGKKLSTWRKAVEDAYNSDESDEFIKPRIIGDYKGVEKDDSIIFFNYRLDRARQLTKAFVEPKFKEFKTNKKHNTYVCMTDFYKGVSNHAEVAFQNINMKNILGEVLSKNNMKQLRIAETEKYAHVTFFFNSENEKPFKSEDRILVHSPREVPTYDLKPEMSAYEVADKLVNAIKNKHYDAIILNFANGDMVGHTGNLKAAIKAVEAVDSCLEKVLTELGNKNGEAIIIADHGNCEDMRADTKTSHTLNKVPFIYFGKRKIKLQSGKLGDVAPSMLKLLGLKQPKEMTGKCLIKNG